MSLKKSLRLLAVGIAVAGCVLVIPTSFGTVDDVCASGNCSSPCPHTQCRVPGCGDEGIILGGPATCAHFTGPIQVGCTIGCRTFSCN